MNPSTMKYLKLWASSLYRVAMRLLERLPRSCGPARRCRPWPRIRSRCGPSSERGPARHPRDVARSHRCPNGGTGRGPWTPGRSVSAGRATERPCARPTESRSAQGGGACGNSPLCRSAPAAAAAAINPYSSSVRSRRATTASPWIRGPTQGVPGITLKHGSSRQTAQEGIIVHSLAREAAPGSRFRVSGAGLRARALRFPRNPEPDTRNRSASPLASFRIAYTYAPAARRAPCCRVMSVGGFFHTMSISRESIRPRMSHYRLRANDSTGSEEESPQNLACA